MDGSGIEVEFPEKRLHGQRAQPLGRPISQLAVAETEIEQRLAELERHQSGIENGQRETVAQELMSLVHGGGTEDQDVGAVLLQGSPSFTLQMREYELLLARQQLIGIGPHPDRADRGQPVGKALFREDLV